MSRCLFRLLAILAVPFTAGAADPSKPESAEAIRELLKPFFESPQEYANDFGNFRSPLKFEDGSPVSNAADWQKRREEIRKTWHDLMGPWPPPIDKPKIELLKSDRRDNFTQQSIRIEVAPERTTEDAYLLIPDGKGPFPAVLVVYYEAKTGVGLGKSELRDFAYQLAKRGFVTLSLGSDPNSYYPNREKVQLQPLSFHGYVA